MSLKHPPKVWIIDDTEANRVLYSAVLRNAGFAVSCFDGGQSALDALSTESPDFILVDFMMPGMSGADFVEVARQQTDKPHLPMIVLTASAASDHIDRALKAGATDYITKPIDSRLLLHRVTSEISAHRSRCKADRVKEASARLNKEMNEAARAQQDQLPEVPVSVGPWRALGAVIPSGSVGGDLFDIFETSDGRFMAALFDVSGHGMASAIVAAEVKTEFRRLADHKSLPVALRVLNERRFEQTTAKYVCVAAIEAYKSQVVLCNAGLPPALLIRNGQVERSVMASGTPIGLFPGSDYLVEHLVTEPGDRFCFVSDGLTEPFGESDDSLAALKRIGLAADNSTESIDLAKLTDEMKQLLTPVSKDILDDATLLITEYVG